MMHDKFMVDVMLQKLGYCDVCNTFKVRSKVNLKRGQCQCGSGLVKTVAVTMHDIQDVIKGGAVTQSTHDMAHILISLGSELLKTPIAGKDRPPVDYAYLLALSRQQGLIAVTEHVEKRIIDAGLVETRGNQSALAALIGINRTTLRKRIAIIKAAWLK